MNLPATRQILGVDTSVGNFTNCSPEVGNAFQRNMDAVSHQTQFYVAELLERGIRVLIYVGTYDWICNWVGHIPCQK
jgi:cathepsin A (carboxypeptidase C)